MAETPVVNASPLIYLSKAGLSELLPLLAARIRVPAAVATEIRQRGASDVTARLIDTTDWLEVVNTPEIPAIIQAWDLGLGESAVLAWAYLHRGSEAIVDDLAARRWIFRYGGRWGWCWWRSSGAQFRKHDPF